MASYLVAVFTIGLGVWVTFWPPKKLRSKVIVMCAFVSLAAAGVWLDTLENEAQERKVLGDSLRPPVLQIAVLTPDASKIEVSIRNWSKLPAYGLVVGMWDSRDFASSQNWTLLERLNIRPYFVSPQPVELAPCSTALIHQFDLTVPPGLEYRTSSGFTATVSTRAISPPAIEIVRFRSVDGSVKPSVSVFHKMLGSKPIIVSDDECPPAFVVIKP